jgi:biotin operon repressor
MPNDSITDSQRLPFLMIPKAFFTAMKPSWRATVAYAALKFYAFPMSCEKASMPQLAQLMNVSEDTIRRGIQELQKKGAVKVHSRSKRSAANGKRIPLPNLYEIVNLDLLSGDPLL